jgi:hypothetical protein
LQNIKNKDYCFALWLKLETVCEQNNKYFFWIKESIIIFTLIRKHATQQKKFYVGKQYLARWCLTISFNKVTKCDNFEVSFRCRYAWIPFMGIFFFLLLMKTTKESSFERRNIKNGII